MTPFDELQREHERLLEGTNAAELTAVTAYIDRARAQAARIGDPRERDQLRANLRYWASVVYDRSGTYPATTLLPAAVAKAIESPATPQSGGEAVSPMPRSIWPWVIGLGVVVLAMLVVYVSQFGLMRPAPGPTNSSTARPAPGADRWPLSATTDLYDKPGSEMTAQVLGRMQAGSEFYAVARTADGQWLKITTVDEISGWIKAADSGVKDEVLKQLPAAAVVIASTSTPTATPFPSATPVASAGDVATAIALPPTSTPWVPQPTPTRAGQKPVTPVPPPNALPLQVNYQVVTYGPSPFNAEAWVTEIRLTAVGGDNHYVFWVNGQRLDGDQYTVDGVACRAVSVTVGATSGGQAVRRDVTLKSPLTKCQ